MLLRGGHLRHLEMLWLFCMSILSLIPIQNYTGLCHHARFWESVVPDKLSYVRHLQQQAPQHKLAKPGGRLPPNVQPSVIQVSDKG